MLAYKDGADVRLISRHGVDHTRRFPEIGAAVGKLPTRTLVLDGEVCVFDAQLVSQFHLLGDTRTDELATPAVYITFDVLHAKARDLRPRPLAYRRSTLEDIVGDSPLVFPALRLDGDGFAAWDEVKRGGWEGLVAKDNSSPFVGGARSGG